MPKKGSVRKRPGQKATKERLSAAQLKLLETMLDPAHRHKSITEICGIAKMDRKTYYRAFQSTLFVKRYEEESKHLALRHAGQVMNAFVREAQRGSFQHGKVILEMAGMYTDKQTHEITGEGGAPLQVFMSIPEPKRGE